MVETLGALVEQYGYLAVAVGCFFEGETAVILGMLASKQGYLSFNGVLVAGFVGTIIGDNFWFHMGRHTGRPFLERHEGWRAKAEQVERLMERFGAPVMIGFRFFYGLRSITPFMLGAARISPLRFFIYEATGALLWLCVVATVGFYLGAAVEQIIGKIHNIEKFVAIAVASIALMVWVVYVIRWRLRLRHEHSD